MKFGGDTSMWMFVWLILTIKVTECYRVLIKYDENDEPLPLVVCEGYQHFTVIPCWGSYMNTAVPKWVRWNRNDTLIDISQDIATPACRARGEAQDGTYISVAGTNQTFFLLSKMTKDNDGDKFACFKPDEDMEEIKSNPDGLTVPVVIKVLPKEECLEGQRGITTDIATTQTMASHGRSEGTRKSPAYSTDNTCSRHMLIFGIVLGFLMLVIFLMILALLIMRRKNKRSPSDDEPMVDMSSGQDIDII